MLKASKWTHLSRLLQTALIKGYAIALKLELLGLRTALR